MDKSTLFFLLILYITAIFVAIPVAAHFSPRCDNDDRLLFGTAILWPLALVVTILRCCWAYLRTIPGGSK